MNNDQNNTDAPAGALRFLTHADVIDRVRVSKPTLARWIQQGSFPPSISTSGLDSDGNVVRSRTLLWDERIVNEWMAERTREAAEQYEQRKAAKADNNRRAYA